MPAGVMIGTPRTRPIMDEYFASLWATKLERPSAWKVVKNRPIDVGRNEIVDEFLKTKDYEYLFFIDSDAMWHPKAIERLIGHDLAVVTGCIYTRKLPPWPTMGDYEGLNRKGIHTYNKQRVTEQLLKYAQAKGLDTKSSNIQCLEEPELVEIDGTGMHFCAVRRDVLEAIEPPWFEVNEVGAGEDYYFCRRAKEAGFRIWCDLSVQTGHVAGDDFVIGLRELMAFIEYNNDFEALRVEA